MHAVLRSLTGSVLDPKFRNRSRFTRALALKFFNPYFNFRFSRIPHTRRAHATYNYLIECHKNPIFTKKNEFIDSRVISAFGLICNEKSLVLNLDTISNPGFNPEKLYSRMNYSVDSPTQISKPTITAFTVLPYNFYHFMTDFVLPYLAQSEKDRELFLPFRPTERQKEILEFFRVKFSTADFQANHQFRNVKILPTIFIERKLGWELSTSPNDNYAFNDNLLNKARKEILEHTLQFRRQLDSKVFISRRGATRAPVGIEEIEQVFRDHGFQIYNSEEFSLNDTIQLFQNARLIVGLHGAGLMNLIFARNNCRVLELVPNSHKMGGEVRPVFELMADAFEFEYQKSRTPLTFGEWEELVSTL